MPAEATPEDDARAIVPPTEEQYQALIHAAKQLWPIAPLLPEVVELLGEFGLRPGELFHLPWESVDWNPGHGEKPGRPPGRGTAAHAHARRGMACPPRLCPFEQRHLERRR